MMMMMMMMMMMISETTTTKMPRPLVGPFCKEEEEENVESFPPPPRAALRGYESQSGAAWDGEHDTLRTTTTTTMVQKERVEIIGFNLSGVFCLRYIFFFDFVFRPKRLQF